MSDLQPKLEASMRSIAEKAADQIGSSQVVGLGSGSAVTIFARVLGERLASRKLAQICIVPSSMQAWLLATQNDLPLQPDSAHCPARIDITVDGADQVATESRSMIKGGGGALFREKIILSSSAKSFILIDSSKIEGELTKAVPVEVAQFAVNPVSERIRKKFGVDPALRKLQKGYPFFTESGNVILDVQMKQPINDPMETEKSLKALPGVLEVGVFNCPVEKFYVANPDGSIDSI